MSEELSKKGLLEVKASVIKTYLEMLKEGNTYLVIDDLETELEVTEKKIADIERAEKMIADFKEEEIDNRKRWKEEIEAAKILADIEVKKMVDKETEEVSSK